MTVRRWVPIVIAFVVAVGVQTVPATAGPSGASIATANPGRIDPELLRRFQDRPPPGDSAGVTNWRDWCSASAGLR